MKQTAFFAKRERRWVECSSAVDQLNFEFLDPSVESSSLIRVMIEDSMDFKAAMLTSTVDAVLTAYPVRIYSDSRSATEEGTASLTTKHTSRRRP